MKHDDLFGNDVNNWQDEWVGMPEYKNVIVPKPVITAKFKFRTKEDYDKFHGVIKEHLYGGNKVFDGMQSENEKQAWYPLNEKASKYRYI